MDSECRSEFSYEPSVADDADFNDWNLEGGLQDVSFDGPFDSDLFGQFEQSEPGFDDNGFSRELSRTDIGTSCAFASETSPAVETSEPTPVTGSAWNTMLAQAFSANLNVVASLPLPWETGTLRDIFSDSFMPTFAPAITDDANLSCLNQNSVLVTSEVLQTTTDDQVRPAYLSAVKSIKGVDYVSGKKAQMTLATSKWLEILSIDWRCSSVGEQVAADLQEDPTGDRAEHTLRAVFGVKSPSTVLKRAASLRQYIAWFHKDCTRTDRYICPFPLTESDVWNYFLHLRQMRKDNHRGYTVSSTFLETVRFCKFLLGMYWSDTILSSKCLLGFSAVERREKGPLNQAPSLELEHLQQFRNILEHGENGIDRIGAGAFLCTIYARARWSDMRFIHHIKYDGFQRMLLWTCTLLSTKQVPLDCDVSSFASCYFVRRHRSRRLDRCFH